MMSKSECLASKTLHDFSTAPVGHSPRLWRCSGCSTEGPWSKSWTYYGNMECKHCGYAHMDWVACSAECAKKRPRRPGEAG